jgi:hypothetical protein
VSQALLLLHTDELVNLPLLFGHLAGVLLSLPSLVVSYVSEVGGKFRILVNKNLIFRPHSLEHSLILVLQSNFLGIEILDYL